MSLTTPEANRLALGDRAKAVREALLCLGMRRCSLRLVHYQAEPRPLRLDWYGLYWRWLRALHLANPDGADFLFEDLRSRFTALRDGDCLSRACWYEQLAECEREHSEAIRAAILDRDPRLIRKEIAEAISALRRQLALLDAREGRRGEFTVGVL
ncbi:MAG: hypothetical protein ABW250_22525 [Pyrinomonadaceae bacterium]